jgi:hypothetical protein
LGHGKRGKRSRQLNLSCKQTKIKPQIKTKLKLPKEKKTIFLTVFYYFQTFGTLGAEMDLDPMAKLSTSEFINRI